MIAGKTGGRVSIGAVSTAKYFVPFAISAFSKRYPNIEIKLSIGNRQEIRKALRGYDLDFAVMGRPPADVDVDVHLIGDIRMSSSRRRRIAWRERSGLALTDLGHETFLTREPGSGTRGLMEQLFETAGARPEHRHGDEQQRDHQAGGHRRARHRLHFGPHGRHRTRRAAAGRRSMSRACRSCGNGS